jgi:endonuclease-3
VNMVTPALFERYPDPAALAKATPEELEPLIHSTGFFRAKSRSLIGMATALVDQHDGEVPADMDALTALPGVGRKTANVVLGHALGIPGLPVDRHVLRVSNRIGLVESDDPEEVEQQLCALLPKQRWTRASDTLILHGRRVCKPKPLCPVCSVQAYCVYFQTGAATDDRMHDRPTGAKKAAGVAKRAVRVAKPAKSTKAGASVKAGASKPKPTPPGSRGPKPGSQTRSARPSSRGRRRSR